jgi:hypothetical protein
VLFQERISTDLGVEPIRHSDKHHASLSVGVSKRFRLMETFLDASRERLIDVLDVGDCCLKRGIYIGDLEPREGRCGIGIELDLRSKGVQYIRE